MYVVTQLKIPRIYFFCVRMCPLGGSKNPDLSGGAAVHRGLCARASDARRALFRQRPQDGGAQGQRRTHTHTQICKSSSYATG